MLFIDKNFDTLILVCETLEFYNPLNYTKETYKSFQLKNQWRTQLIFYEMVKCTNEILPQNTHKTINASGKS
jgi:hypothetical protein